MKDLPMKRSVAVQTGADQLFVVEAKIDDTLAEAAALMTTLSRLRIDGRFSAVLGQDAIVAVGRVVSTLTEARGALVEAHHHLDTVKTQVGCGAMAIGDLQNKPEKKEDDRMLRHTNNGIEAA